MIQLNRFLRAFLSWARAAILLSSRKSASVNGEPANSTEKLHRFLAVRFGIPIHSVCAKWNGTVGREVRLQQGLRQGCVLSPALYCLFISPLVAVGAGAHMPPDRQGVTEKFFAQEVSLKKYGKIHHKQGCGKEHLCCFIMIFMAQYYG